MGPPAQPHFYIRRTRSLIILPVTSGLFFPVQVVVSTFTHVLQLFYSEVARQGSGHEKEGEAVEVCVYGLPSSLSPGLRVSTCVRPRVSSSKFERRTTNEVKSRSTMTFLNRPQHTICRLCATLRPARLCFSARNGHCLRLPRGTERRGFLAISILSI